MGENLRQQSAPMGENLRQQSIRRICGDADNLHKCLVPMLRQRYQLRPLWSARKDLKLKWDEPLRNTRKVLPHCHRHDVRTRGADTAMARRLQHAHRHKRREHLVRFYGGNSSEYALGNASFVHAALHPFAPSRLNGTDLDIIASFRRRYKLKVKENVLTPSSQLHCDSKINRLDTNILLLIGVPSDSTGAGRRRRDAARSTWHTTTQFGKSIVACNLLSAQHKGVKQDVLILEALDHRDMLFLQAPETPDFLRNRTRYSGFRRLGRGMPTFIQYSFFRHVAIHLPNIPYVAKIDDDTYPNLRLLHPMLVQLRCLKYAFIGSIQWASYIPKAKFSGVRGDRCGFSWDMYGAIRAFTDMGDGRASCLAKGGVVPLPYAAGAAYIFSGPVLNWVGTASTVRNWVDEAGGPDREEFQWQKYEDTTTGYWLSYAPMNVTYVNIGYWLHDFACYPNAEVEKTHLKGFLNRPPANFSLFVHQLKSNGFDFVHHVTQSEYGTPRYDHERCVAHDLVSVRKP